jgi:aspartate aminotransferase
MLNIIFNLIDFRYICDTFYYSYKQYNVMPEISEKARKMPASPIRKLVPYAEEAKRRGRTVYHLNIGQPDIHTPEQALETLKTTDIRIIEYTHSAGNESYRRKLAESYRKLGIMIDHTEIIVTTGGSEAVLFAFMSCLNHGEEVITFEPFYANYNGFATAAGVTIVPVRSFIENDFALPPISEIKKKITRRTRAILICNPNNPTGALYSHKELMQLRDIVREHDLFLLSDEVYREFCYGEEHFSVMKLDGIEQNVILLDSVSKRYSMCGVRIGALITHNREVLDAALKFAQARLCPPGLGQIVAEAALDTPAEYFKEVYNEYIARRDFMVKALNAIPGVYCPMPRGAFYTVVRLPVDDVDEFAKWLLQEFSYKGQTVMIAPASGFYFTPDAGKNEARVAYVLKIDDLRKAMETLAEALRVYPGRID